jgi:hypothetical protein
LIPRGNPQQSLYALLQFQDFLARLRFHYVLLIVPKNAYVHTNRPAYSLLDFLNMQNGFFADAQLSYTFAEVVEVPASIEDAVCSR